MASATTTTNTRTLECLQRSQANSICMYLNAKRYHWYTFGPLFRDLHHLFDEIAMAHFEDMDPFGERLRILGGDASSSPGRDQVAQHRGLLDAARLCRRDALRSAGERTARH